MTDIKELFREAFAKGDLDAAFDGLVGEAKKLGMPYVAYGCVNHEISQGDGKPVVRLHYPANWRKRYEERNYFRIDPIVRMPLISDGPVVWSKMRNLTEEQQDLMDDAYEHGLVDGVSFPLHGPNSALFVASFASGDLFRGREITPFRNLAACFHQGALSMLDFGTKKFVRELTVRQFDILEAYGEDLAFSEIAAKLGISNSTVTNEVNRIKRALNVKSAQMALVVAFQYGLVGRIRKLD